MKTYIFLGVKADVPDANPSALTYFGQPVDIPDSRIAEALNNGLQVIPKETFDALPFTHEEKKSDHFGSTMLHSRLGESFALKRKAAWETLETFRLSALNPTTPAPNEDTNADVL